MREGERWILPADGFAVDTWEGWETPRWHEVPKASYGIVRDALPALRSRR